MARVKGEAVTEFRDNRNIKTERQFYLDALSRAEAGAAATGYGHPINQKMRFDALLDNVFLDEDEPYSLLDVGCGTGDLFVYLATELAAPQRYLGIDIMPEMIDRAKTVVPQAFSVANMKMPETAEFQRGTINDVWGGPAYTDGGWDYAVSIAAYAIKEETESMADNLLQVQDAVAKMVDVAKKAVAITLFSPYKTEIMPKEMVIDPAAMFTWAKTKYERVDLIHGYAPFDYMLVIRNEPSAWRQEWDRTHGRSILREER